MVGSGGLGRAEGGHENMWMSVGRGRWPQEEGRGGGRAVP